MLSNKRWVEALEQQLWKRIELKHQAHELEVLQLERRLAEYTGLPTEAKIKRETDLFNALRRFRLRGFEHWGYDEPPSMRPKYPIMPRATTDWDFSDAHWTLDPTVYVSPPSSLRQNFLQ